MTVETIFLTSERYRQAWNDVERSVGATGDEPRVVLLASLAGIKNSLIGNQSRKVDAVRHVDLQPLFKAIVCTAETPQQEDTVLRVRAEAATVAGLLCFPHEHAVRAITTTSHTTSLLASLLGALADLFPSHAFDSPSDPTVVISTIVSLTPRHLALLKALLRALAAFLGALRDVGGPRTWGGMTRAPERVHRARQQVPSPMTALDAKKVAERIKSKKAKGFARPLQRPAETSTPAAPDPSWDFHWSAPERKWQTDACSKLSSEFIGSPICSVLLPSILALRPAPPNASFRTNAPSSSKARSRWISPTVLLDLAPPTLQIVAASFVHLHQVPGARLFAVKRFFSTLKYWLEHDDPRCAEAALLALHSVCVGVGLFEGRSPTLARSTSEEAEVLELALWSFWESSVDGTGHRRLRGPGWTVVTRLPDLSARVRAAAVTNFASIVYARREELLADPSPRSGPMPILLDETQPKGGKGLQRMLDAIIFLLHDTDASIRAQAAYALAHYTASSEAWQMMAHEKGAVLAVRQLLIIAEAKVEPYPSASVVAEKSMLRESALLALASLSAINDAPRRTIIATNVLPFIVGALSDPSAPVRAAACQCCRALSRAVSILRTSLLDEGAGPKLFDLIVDGDPSCGEGEDDVRVVAMAAVCNLVLDFSPMKQDLLDRGGVAKLVDFTADGKPQLRLFALFALKNMAFSASLQLKTEIATSLGWERIASLLEDPDINVQEHAFSLIRNFAYGHPADVDLLVEGLGESRLVALLESILRQHYTGALAAAAMAACQGTAARDRVTTGQRVVVHALYVTSNVSTGTEKHKMIVAGSQGLLRLLTHLLLDPNPDIRVASAWCVLNLLHRDAVRRSPAAPALRALGIENLLRTLKEDEVLDVRERARDALDHLEGKVSTDF